MQALNKILALVVVVTYLISCSTAKLTINKEATLYMVDHSIATDSQIVNYYLPFKNRLESEMNRVIGYSNFDLTKSRSEAETSAGNFLVDALLEIGKSIDTNTQISLATKGGIRAEIKKGNVTVGNIFELMPFENTISILELSGHDLNTMLEYVAKTGGQPMAGVSMTIKDSKPLKIIIQGKPFNINQNYTLVTYDYLANGGDYMEGLGTPIKRNDTGIIVRNGLIKYIEGLSKEGKTINTTIDGRITIIK